MPITSLALFSEESKLQEAKQTQTPVLIEAVFKQRNIDNHRIRKIHLTSNVVEKNQGKGGAGLCGRIL